MNQPIVSVIMNCYNSATYLSEAIDSVYAQTFRDWEIIFYDNDSIDNSAEIAKSYDHKLKYFKSEKTISLGAARKAAIDFSEGKYIAFLDCDDLWLPEKLERQVAAIAQAHFSERRNGLCYTSAVRIDGAGNTLLPYAYRIKLAQGNIYKALIEDCFIACSATLMDKEVYRVTGDFDEKYHMVEELDLWLRIAKDYDVVLVDQALTKIRMHAHNQSNNNLITIEEYGCLLTEKLIKDSDVADLCKKKIDELRLRKMFVRMAVAKKGVARFLKNFCVVIGFCLLHPIISMRFFKKYFSFNMIYLFFKKF